ncbi:MAG: acyl-CoA reductase [Bacteriovorax sp.]|jgi:phenylacetate-coenzyme A ligase PaaK-like adenylate-forming protein
MSNISNLWQGKITSDSEFKTLFYTHMNDAGFWSKKPLSTSLLFSLVNKASHKLKEKGPFYQSLVNDLQSRTDIREDEIKSSMQGLEEFLSIDNLRLKLLRELGSEFPFELKRINFRENHFESWFPLGVLVHVTPNNSPLLGVLGVMEGLLSGNVNVLKLARKDSSFAALFYQELCALDESNTFKDYVYIGKVSSSDKSYLKDFLSIADVASLWGSEESIKSLKEMAPARARIVEWGHKISFSYISKATSRYEVMLKKMAFEICNNEQMACSSPQCIFLEDADFEELKLFAKNLGQALDIVSPTIKRVMPGIQEIAELTVSKEQARLNSMFGGSDAIISKTNDWRIYIEDTPILNASPLFRTIWVKPMPKNKILQNLRPLKVYLQTAGLSAHKDEVEELTRLLFQAGVQRVRAIGEMTDSYLGEPHDGVYALERYCQKISYTDSPTLKLMDKKHSFEEPSRSIAHSGKIMEKSDFQAQVVPEEYADLYFHSGGSSGEPKLSVFTYADYHRQMEVAAEGLYAAGLDPGNDRCMNLFYAGSLYGGFISFFTILEKMSAVHFPMGASTEFAMVGKTIVKNKVDTLLGMPSYFIQLFSANHELFKQYRGIKKIFFGGEHFSESQRNFFKNEYGVEIIRSASYGSVDAGPLGFQCEYAVGGIHHLNDRLHDLEVVELEQDRPVKTGEVGRFLFTSKVRHGQRIERYAIGDVGRVLEGRCGCGRTGTRFELLGRHGDVFRIGTIFLSYQKFQKLLIDKFDFEGSFQLHLHPGVGVKKEKILLKIENLFKTTVTKDMLEARLIKDYGELEEVVKKDLVLDFEVEITERKNLEFSSSTGKLRSVLDHRN